MLFQRERSRVTNATRAIRDLVVPRKPAELQATGGDLGTGLQLLARLALGPLRLVPQAAARLPEMLRELGDRRRVIPGERRLSPDPTLALRALAGYLKSDGTLRERYLNLLSATMDSAVARSVHPAFLEVLGQLTADEARIFSSLDTDGPFPVISVQSRGKHGGFTRAELRNFSLLGEAAHCDLPERTPMYIDNLCRLGLLELRPTRVSEDTRMFRALENHPRITELTARVEGRPGIQVGPLTEPVVADIQRKYLFVTSFGRQFYEACEYIPS
jgi:hypothetical protein